MKLPIEIISNPAEVYGVLDYITPEPHNVIPAISF